MREGNQQAATNHQVQFFIVDNCSVLVMLNCSGVTVINRSAKPVTSVSGTGLWQVKSGPP